MRESDQDRLQAAQALQRALTIPAWPKLDINLDGRMARVTLRVLENYRHIAEVAEVLSNLHSNSYIDSRLWHYLKRKYEDKMQEITEPADMDRLFNAILTDQRSTVHRPGIRYMVLSSQQQWIAVVDPAGLRISVMLAKDLQYLGEPLWTIADLNV